MKVVIRKKMMSGDEWLMPGDVVDASGWKQLKNLINNRYVEEFKGEVVEEKPKPKAKAKKTEPEAPVEE
jgi:hypothetical protein